MILGVVLASCRIFHATVRLDEPRVVILFREFACSQKEHVLAKMCQAVVANRVVEAAGADIKGCRGLLCLSILHEQAFHFVGQFDVAIVALVARRLANAV